MMFGRKKKIEPEREGTPTVYSFDKDANDRIVYIDGAHGAGKSLLIEDIKDGGKLVIREQVGHLESLDENYSRQMWRLALHAIEHRENLWYATNNEGSAILGDRCYIDDFAYMRAFAKLGWMEKDVEQAFERLSLGMYSSSKTPLPKMHIVLIPPISWNIERIEERWERGERVKWNERDYTYLAFVRDEYEILAGEMKGNTIVVREVDREKRLQVIKDWIFNVKSILSGTSYVEGRMEPTWSSP